jgi:hypothetical protein
MHQLNEQKHTDFKVLAVRDMGGNRFEVKSSAKFDGRSVRDYLTLWATDELDAFALASKVYEEKTDGR